MKWWPSSPKKGDMIRVRIGAVYHYGIFVSENEVIQFGPPPTAERLRESQTFCVIATDIDTFCGGVIAEVAKAETREEKKRFSPRKTVTIAKARLGERGYDLIHNNCEHFAYECVYGIKHSSQAEDARERWRNRPILNVYVLPVSCDMPIRPVYPPEREAEIQAANEQQRLLKYAAWRALKEGLFHAFHAEIETLSFRKNEHGKWSCDKYEFSISHTKEAVAVALSNGKVGVDLESEADFAAKQNDAFPSLCRHVLTETELAQTPDLPQFLSMWTRKESIFKCFDGTRFVPQQIESEHPLTATRTFDMEARPMTLSVCGEKIDTLCCYLLGGDRPCRMEMKKTESELSL